MTTGEKRFKFFEDGHGYEALQLGVISTAVYSKYVAYKMYLEYRSKGITNREALELVAEDTKSAFSTADLNVRFFINK